MLMKNFEFKGFMKSAMPAIQEKLITCKPDTRHQNISVTRNRCNEILVNYILVKFWKTIKLTLLVAVYTYY
jgi:hypothetical protein